MKSLIFFVIFLEFLSLTEAHIFLVGGEDGWMLKPSENYTHWSERNRFLVQDQLVFKYEKGMDSVYVVKKDDYATCNKDDPIKSLKNQKGESKFEFDKSGPFYFISGHEQNCEKGQKFVVVVLSTHHRPRSNTVPSPKSQPPASSSAVEPPSTSPSNTDHRSKSPSPSPVSNQDGSNSKGPSPSPSSSTKQSKSPSPSPSSPKHQSESQSPSQIMQSPSKSPLSPPPRSTESHYISPTSPSPSSQIHSKGPISSSPNNIVPLVQPPSSNPNPPFPVNSNDIGAPHPSLLSPLGSPAPAPSSNALGFRASFIGLKETVLVMLVMSDLWLTLKSWLG